MVYEVVCPDEPIDGLLRAALYVSPVPALAKGTPGERERAEARELVACFTAPTWRMLQEEARAYRQAHEQGHAYVFDTDGNLMPKA